MHHTKESITKLVSIAPSFVATLDFLSIWKRYHSVNDLRNVDDRQLTEDNKNLRETWASLKLWRHAERENKKTTQSQSPKARQQRKIPFLNCSSSQLKQHTIFIYNMFFSFFFFFFFHTTITKIEKSWRPRKPHAVHMIIYCPQTLRVCVCVCVVLCMHVSMYVWKSRQI